MVSIQSADPNSILNEDGRISGSLHDLVDQKLRKAKGVGWLTKDMRRFVDNRAPSPVDIDAVGNIDKGTIGSPAGGKRALSTSLNVRESLPAEATLVLKRQVSTV